MRCKFCGRHVEDDEVEVHPGYTLHLTTPPHTLDGFDPDVIDSGIEIDIPLTEPRDVGDGRARLL